MIRPIDMKCGCGIEKEVFKDTAKPFSVRCTCGGKMKKKEIQLPGYRRDHTIRGG